MLTHLTVAAILGCTFACCVIVYWLYVQQKRELKSRSDSLALQVDIIEYFSQSTYQNYSQEDILWDIAEHCIDRLEFEDCVIYLLNQERQVWEQKAAYGPKNINYREIHQPIFIPLNRGIVGSVGASGRSEIIVDTRLDNRYILDDDMRLSEMAVPIKADGRVIGVIDSEHPDVNFYQPHHLRIVENIAAVCAHKIARSLSEREKANTANFFLRNPNPVFRVSDQHVVTLANEACATHLPGLVVQHQSIEMEDLINSMEGVFASQQSDTIRIAFNERVFQLNVVLALSGDSVNVYGTDVTDLEQARALAQKAERAKANFLSVMSHEIRTPLNAILGLNTLLSDSASSDLERPRLLAEMGAAGKHLLSLINNILDFERISAGRLALSQTPFDAIDMFNELISIFNQQAKENGNTLHLSLPEDMPRWLSGDRNSIMQMLTNLIGNALKFTRNGRVEVNISRDESPDRWKIAVCDSGDGIKRDDIERIFVPFEQLDEREKNTKRRGSGLGLAITKQLAELHGGSLSVESTWGEGSCFTLLLPLPPTTPAIEKTAGQPKTEPVKDVPQSCVLVVDDNAINVLVAQRTIEQWNYSVITAADGKQAIEAWRQHSPDVILMDLHMPVMNGMEAAEQIGQYEAAQQLKHTPIIALTADAETETREQAIRAGMVDVLTKPFDREILQQTLIRHCSPADGQQS